MFQSPRVVAEDLPACYPVQYYTHTPKPPQVDLAPPSGLAALRHALAEGVRDGSRGTAGPGVVRRLARTVSRLRRCREQFWFGLVDELIPRGATPGRALDVGCGAGALMLALQRAGWEVEGVEWDSRAAEAARTATGCPVTVGDFRQGAVSSRSYDLVVLSHVFEHLAEPVEALSQLRQLLASHGRLVLIYPNPEALGARWFGDCWQSWDPPRHLVLPAAGALGHHAVAAGFRSCQVRTVTRVRWAAEAYRHSRAYQRGAPVENVSMSAADVWLARLGALLAGTGARLGEEIIAVLGDARG